MKIFCCLSFVLAMAAVACSSSLPAPEGAPTTPQPPSTEGAAESVAIANPASTHCVEQGGTLEMQKDASQGEFGVCVFPDGSRCEEWRFFRNECQPAQCREETGICQ